MRDELHRREVFVSALEAFFRARPATWIRWEEIAAIAGSCAWRTRLSDLRLKRGMTIEWNKSVRASAYRYLPPAIQVARDQVDAVINQRLF